MTGVAAAPPAIITSHCQSEPQPSNGCLAAAQQQQNAQRRHGRAGGGTEDKLRERQFAQNQIAPQANREADGKERQDADAERIGRQRVKPQSAEHGEQRNGHDVRVQGGVNHQRRQQIHLRAEQLARQLETRPRRTPRETRRPESKWFAGVHQLAWELQHPDLVQRAEVGGQFHTRLGVKAEFGLAANPRSGRWEFPPGKSRLRRW